MINPIRLKGKPANIARYYTVGDYYTKGTEEQSQWGGKIAAELGLEGEVDPGTFKELLAGIIAPPDGGKRGTQQVWQDTSDTGSGKGSSVADPALPNPAGYRFAP